MKSRAFTLIELLLYVSLSGVIIFTTTMLLMSVLDARAKNQTILTVDSEGAKAMTIINQTVRNATAINLPANSGDTGAELRLNGSTIRFSLTNGIIQMYDNGDTIPLTSCKVTISNLQFRNLSGTSTPGNIDTTFTVTYGKPSDLSCN